MTREDSLDEVSAKTMDDGSSVRSSLSEPMLSPDGDDDDSGSDQDRAEEDAFYSSESDEEDEISYKTGGYHPVHVRARLCSAAVEGLNCTDGGCGTVGRRSVQQPL